MARVLLAACLALPAKAWAQDSTLKVTGPPADYFMYLHDLTHDAAVPRRTIIRRVNVLHPNRDKGWKRFRTVIVQGDGICRVRTSLLPTRKRGSTVVTARRQYLTPGFIDMHMHHMCADPSLELFYLLNGITAAREMNGWADKAALRALIRSNTLLWPDYFSTKCQYKGLNADLLRDVERRLREIGNDSIPFGQACDFHLISADGETPTKPSFELAVRHGKPVALESVLPFPVDTVGSPHLYTLEKLGGLVDPSSTRVNLRACDTLIDRQVALVPCLNNFPMRFTDYAAAYSNWPYARFVDDAQIEAWTDYYLDPMGIRDSLFAMITRRKQADADVVRAYLNRGGRVLVGSETGPGNPPMSLPGFAYHDEMEALQALGMTPRQVLDAATQDAAETLGQDTLFGRVAKGMRADLVLLTEDPLADIKATRKIKALVLRGQLLKEADLLDIDRYLDALFQ